MAKRSTTERGYGHDHQLARQHWEPIVQAGGVDCARCGRPIDPDEPWDLGHTDDRKGYTGPEHMGCNRSAGGANGAAVTNAARAMIVREW